MLALVADGTARKGTWMCISCSARAGSALRAAFGSGVGAVGRPLHQRKHSSSKTPNAAKEEARALAASAKSPSKALRPTSGLNPSIKSLTTATRKKKTKESLQQANSRNDVSNALSSLPSVASTQKIHPLDIHIASFFSQHRPISVSHVIPPSVSSEAFLSLFEAPRHDTKSKHSDVIHTLSSAVDDLDHAIAQQQAHGSQRGQISPEEVEVRIAVAQAASAPAEVSTNNHNEQRPSRSLQTNLQSFAGRFQPFVPPPPPVPFDASKAAAEKKRSLGSERQASSQIKPGALATERAWTATLTVVEQTDEQGNRSYRSYATPVSRAPSRGIPLTQVETFGENEPWDVGQTIDGSSGRPDNYLAPGVMTRSSQPFLDRMHQRQLAHLDRVAAQRQQRRPMDARAGRSPTDLLYAISVKRQRKLKMKKHKYKKLMKRTKNLRRRLDRL